MTRHRVRAAALLAPLLLVAACTSTAKHTLSISSAPNGSPESSAAKSLESSMHAALATVTSTAISIDAGALIATTTGHIALHDGTATASDLTIGTGAEATRVITVGTTAYAHLPAGENTTGKPYVLVSATSSNEFVRGLVADLQILQAASSLGDLADLLATATGFTDAGPATVAGVPAHHYRFDVSGDAHGSNLQKQLAALASAPVPVELWTNAQSLPVQVVLSIKVGGATLPVTATLGSFDAPVSITAPPGNEIAGG